MFQYTLESSSEPIGISEYELSRLYPENFKGTLPSIEEIEQEFSDNRLSDWKEKLLRVAIFVM